MLIVQIQVRVKPQFVNEFIEATLENARLSLLEPGIARFDVLQDESNAELFVFTEVYRSAEAPDQHKTTAHYLKWRATVDDMMAEPRSRRQFSNVFPGDEAY